VISPLLLLFTHWDLRIAAAEERREDVKGVTGGGGGGGGEEGGRIRSAVEEQNEDGNGSEDEYGTGHGGFRQHGGGGETDGIVWKLNNKVTGFIK
jgi:hypothetical protein